jgi:hypothetical protein
VRQLRQVQDSVPTGKRHIPIPVAISCVLAAVFGLSADASFHARSAIERGNSASPLTKRLAIRRGTAEHPLKTTATLTAVQPPTTPSTTPTAQGGNVPPGSMFLQGAYVGAANPGGMATFARATGTHPTIASDYLPASNGWTGMDGAGGSLSWMFASGWSGSGYTLSIGVPIIPTNSTGVANGTLANGATGAYNAYFVTLAHTLVAAGEANAYLRLGWEFDGNSYAWSATTSAEEESYASYFRQIVTAMRSVSGEAFRFVWNPDASAFIANGYSVAAAYPGSAYVDYIGLDAYDESWATPRTPAATWTQADIPEFTDALQFATSQGRPLAFCEWGVAIGAGGHGLGDDPLFVNDMITWMRSTSHDVAYESYFNYNSDGANSKITGGDFPNSLKAFKADLGLSSPLFLVHFDGESKQRNSLIPLTCALGRLQMW